MLPVSLVYQIISAFYQWARPTYRAPVPVICIGNAVVGGSGKTPLVRLLVSYLIQTYPNLAVVSRGYKGRLQGPIRVDPRRHGSDEVGDEPLMLAQVVPTWIGKNRRQTVAAAVEKGHDLIVLDDGLQDQSVQKDLSVLVVSGPAPFGNGWSLPAGPLREPLDTCLRKVHVLVYRDIAGVPAPLPLPSELPRFTTRAHLNPQDVTALTARKLVAFAGIAYPHRFFASLRFERLQLIETQGFADHHVFSDQELESLETLARTQDALLVTTEKDYQRLPMVWKNKVVPVRLQEDFTNPNAVISWILNGLPRGKKRIQP